MRTFFNKMQREAQLIDIMYIIFGLLLVFLNTRILTTAIVITGWVLICFAVMNLVNYFIRRTSLSTIPLMIAIPSVILGLSFIRNPEWVIRFSSTFIGVVMVFNGIAHTQSALVYRDYEYPQWKRELAYGILVLIAGLIIWFFPIQTLSTALRIYGAIFAINGLISLFTKRSYKKHLDDNDIVIDADYTERDD